MNTQTTIDKAVVHRTREPNRYEVRGDTVVIFLERKDGSVLECLIDLDCYHLVKSYRWSAWKSRRTCRTFYAVSNNLYMHRLLTQNKWEQVQHRNLNGLDNRFENLRETTNSENHANVQKQRGKYSSRFKGVCKRRSKWQAQIEVNKKRHHLGYFSSQEAAGRAYDAAAKKYFGAFARLNFPENPIAEAADKRKSFATSAAARRRRGSHESKRRQGRKRPEGR